MPTEDAIPVALAAAWLVALGATIGSFLNVVIARVPAGLSIVRPGSRCPRCEHPIAWYDNVPIASWFALRGKCRACRGPISFRYPLVEAGIAAVFVAAYARHGLTLAALGEAVAVALLVALALIDLDTWQLPHALTWPLVAWALLLAAAGSSPAHDLGASALGGLIGFAAFGLIWLLGERVLHKELMGLGDAFLLAGIGAWMGLSALLPVVLLASLQGALVGAVQLLVGKGQPGPSSTGATPTDAVAAASPAAEAPSVEAPSADGPPPEASALDSPPAPVDDEWIPPRHAVPFGPFLALGALEWLYLASGLAERVPVLGVFR